MHELEGAPLESATVTPLIEESRWLIGRARAPRLRTMRQFAEQEIVIPDGPYEGRRFTCERQPYTAVWFAAVDSGLWSRLVATGPTQSGKTLTAYVIPMLYHLFEIGETVIGGVPDMDMAADKWREDLLPAIERTQFREMLPRSGAGSRGGKIDTVRFQNGATLKFMSGGGGDKSRAGFTSRVVIITETDGMDESSDTSREADKITQLEARTRAYGNRKRVYMECTVSVELGRTWTEYKDGTESRIMLPCPHCAAYVQIERDNLVGWKDAEDAVDARSASEFCCSDCGSPWTEDQRRSANLSAVLVHKGQEITPDGEAVGPIPKTDTLGFRWSAANNLFLTAGDIGADEWRASRAADEDNADREMRQFVWCLPYEPSLMDLTPLDPRVIVKRVRDLPKGSVPEDTQYLTVGVDIGKYNAGKYQSHATIISITRPLKNRVF